MAPDARLRETLGELIKAGERLPRVLDSLERSISMIAAGELKLHPETLHALRNDSSGRLSLIATWVAIALLAGALAFL
jgi:ubiquinone biosynthesis protein